MENEPVVHLLYENGRAYCGERGNGFYSGDDSHSLNELTCDECMLRFWWLLDPALMRKNGIPERPTTDPEWAHSKE